MEHRLNRRIQLRIPIEVYADGKLVATGHSKNLCKDGMYLESKYQPHRGQGFVDIAVVNDGQKTQPGQHFKGLIIHADEKGMGILLYEERDFLAYVQSLLQEPELPLLRAS